MRDMETFGLWKICEVIHSAAFQLTTLGLNNTKMSCVKNSKTKRVLWPHTASGRRGSTSSVINTVLAEEITLTHPDAYQTHPNTSSFNLQGGEEPLNGNGREGLVAVAASERRGRWGRNPGLE